MKKKMGIILLAILVGVILALPAIKVYLPEKGCDAVEVYVLQTGIYDDLENAKESKEKIANSIIYQDNNQYRVLVGASMTEENLSKIEQILTEENIHFYKKKLTVPVSHDLFYKYNLMLEKTSDKDAVLLINKKMLEKMMEL